MKWHFHRELLLDTFQIRKEKNPSYSLRALARDLGISHPTLSGLMAGSRFPSFKSSQGLSKKLKLNSSLEFLFLRSIALEKKKRGNQRLEKGFDTYLRNDFNSSELAHRLEEEQFQLLSDWYFYAILELTFVDNFETDAKWISKKLGITLDQTWEALEILFRLGLLKKVGKKWMKATYHHTSPDKTKTSVALRKRQKQIIQKSLRSLEKDPLEIRAHHGMTMAINKNKLPEAKEEIRKFLFKMCQLLEVDERQDVYELQVGLFPLSR